MTLEKVVLSMVNDGIFTDGGCSPNPGPGGWGYVVVRRGQVLREDWGSEPHTTNNRMELTALIQALRFCQSNPDPVVIYADSNLCVQTYNTWMAGWKKRGWRRKDGPVENLDLVKQLAELKESCPQVSVRWIKAHAGFQWNEYADQLVQRAREAQEGVKD